MVNYYEDDIRNDYRNIDEFIHKYMIPKGIKTRIANEEENKMGCDFFILSKDGRHIRVDLKTVKVPEGKMDTRLVEVYSHDVLYEKGWIDHDFDVVVWWINKGDMYSEKVEFLTKEEIHRNLDKSKYFKSTVKNEKNGVIGNSILQEMKAKRWF